MDLQNLPRYNGPLGQNVRGVRILEVAPNPAAEGDLLLIDLGTWQDRIAVGQGWVTEHATLPGDYLLLQDDGKPLGTVNSQEMTKQYAVVQA